MDFSLKVSQFFLKVSVQCKSLGHTFFLPLFALFFPQIFLCNT